MLEMVLIKIEINVEKVVCKDSRSSVDVMGWNHDAATLTLS